MHNPFIQTILLDIGSRNSQVQVLGTDDVSTFSTAVIMDKREGTPVAVANTAAALQGKVSKGREVVFPFKRGVIAEFDHTRFFIRFIMGECFKKSGKFYQINRPLLVLAVSTLTTEVELRALLDAAYSAGAGRVVAIFTPLAIAQTTKLNNTTGSLIINIGAGSTDIVAVANNEIILDASLKTGGDDLDVAIAEYIQHKYGVAISNQEAANLKESFLDLSRTEAKHTPVTIGRAVVSGSAMEVRPSQTELREAVQPVLERIVLGIKAITKGAEPELVADIARNGIYLSGSGVKLKGFSEYISRQIGIPAEVMDLPEQLTLKGLQSVVRTPGLIERLSIDLRKFI